MRFASPVMAHAGLTDKRGMLWLMIGSGIFGGWVLLLIVSTERRRRVEDIVRENTPPQKPAAEAIIEVR